MHVLNFRIDPTFERGSYFLDFNFRVVTDKLNTKSTMAMSRRQESFRTKSLKLLECTVCLDTIDVPKTLKCDHSFCKNCLADILKSKLLEDDVLQAPKDRMHITCPNCKLDSEPFNSLGELKTHLFVNQLLDVHNDEIERETPTTVCICKEKARFQCYR